MVQDFVHQPYGYDCSLWHPREKGTPHCCLRVDQLYCWRFLANNTLFGGMLCNDESQFQKIKLDIVFFMWLTMEPMCQHPHLKVENLYELESETYNSIIDISISPDFWQKKSSFQTKPSLRGLNALLLLLSVCPRLGLLQSHRPLTGRLQPNRCGLFHTLMEK